MGQIFLVRHGQASFGAADYDQLSPLGYEQSRLLGVWFAQCGMRFDRVVVGGLKRHRQTAEACLGALPDALPESEWVVDPGLEEYDHVQMLNVSRPELQEKAAMGGYLAQYDNPRRAFQQLFEDAMGRWMSGQHDAEYRESWLGFRGRCVGAVQRVLADTDKSKRAVVFTSGGPIAAISQELLGLTDARTAALNWTIANSSVTKLLHLPGQITVSYMNAYPHLEQTREPKNITYR